ncbi:MAG: DNA processing protein DprA [Candidatus Dichloromethanomonas elyunquensis]|nr:MAG: DNA processing protein DprA [Candidatus Dichloromethanomonas elyunquensis]
MDRQTEKIYRAAILSIPGIGSQRLRQLISICGSACQAWKAEPDSFACSNRLSWIKNFFKMRKRIDPFTIQLHLQKEEISLVMLGEENYPSLLAECSDAPPLLFYKGVLQADKEGLAIVGSRRATPYGKAAASYLARSIAETDYVVVSGLARGIDASSHKGALEADGVTWAFLAGGVDCIYPSEHVGLARLIMKKGALISEYPPGVPPEAGLFPARNRLISGCSRGVIVVEAAEQSGSLITVDFALEQGREVFAVPGPIFSKQSKGTHHLLKMGAKLVSEKEDIFSELLFPPFPPAKGKGITNRKCSNTVKMPDDKNKILEILSDVPLHIDRLTALSSLPPQEIALGLLELELSGEIVQLPGKNYVLQRKG